jgi:hypothetical protein
MRPRARLILAHQRGGCAECRTVVAVGERAILAVGQTWHPKCWWDNWERTAWAAHKANASKGARLPDEWCQPAAS